MEIRIVEIMEIAHPPWGKSRFFNHIFKTLALAGRNQAQLRQTVGRQRGAYRTKGLVLFANPMECVQGNDRVELPAKRQTPSIGDFEAKVRPDCRTVVIRRESDHLG